MSQKRQQDDGKGHSDGTSSPDDKRRKTSFQRFESGNHIWDKIRTGFCSDCGNV